MFFNRGFFDDYQPTDYGGQPIALDIERETIRNPYFRSALWTGQLLQLTLMSIPVGEDIGLEMHHDTDQFLRLEAGYGMVKMGPSPDNLSYQAEVTDGFAIFVPAGTYHNLINMGNVPIKLYSIYAPPNHPKGTIHKTKEEAEKAEYAGTQSAAQNTAE